MNEPKMNLGVVALYDDPKGRTVFTATCFEQGGAAGFTMKERQEMMARDSLCLEVIRGYSSPMLSDHLDQYTCKEIVRKLEGRGAKVWYVYIGYDDKDPS